MHGVLDIFQNEDRGDEVSIFRNKTLGY